LAAYPILIHFRKQFPQLGCLPNFFPFPDLLSISGCPTISGSEGLPFVDENDSLFERGQVTPFSFTLVIYVNKMILLTVKYSVQVVVEVVYSTVAVIIGNTWREARKEYIRVFGANDLTAQEVHIAVKQVLLNVSFVVVRCLGLQINRRSVSCEVRCYWDRTARQDACRCCLLLQRHQRTRPHEAVRNKPHRDRCAITIKLPGRRWIRSLYGAELCAEVWFPKRSTCDLKL
jgi:hypothetical protein